MILIRRIRQNPSFLRGERSSAFDLARGRLVLMGGVFLLAYGFMALRAFDLSVIQARVFDAEAPVYKGEAQNPAANLRADIVDRNGVMLATTLKTASLFADARYIADPQNAAKGLHRIFPDLAYGDVLQKLQSGKSFIWIKRNITPAEQQSVLALGEPGLVFDEGAQRFYPQGALAAHLVGYTNVDANGLAGIERGFDNYLQSGQPLRLTLDIRLQHALRREVAAAMKDFKGVGAAGVIMDVRNGDILAGVSLPDFDPHNLGKAQKDQSFNRLSLGVYELGSVFKIFSTAAFLETRGLPLSTTFDAREPLKRGRHTIRDYHAKNRVLTLPEVFMYSSNIGTAMMAEATGTQALRDFYTDLGLLTPMEFGVKEVARPLVPNPWREISTLTASYGHGISTTPLQMAAAVSSIVNGGVLVKPRLVLPGDGEPVEATQGVRIISEETAHEMRQLLRLVVTQGTGSKAEVAGYKVGG
ncbi:MAG: peptidoglycan D,D-transpeptidase FtsI family protein, partial [Bdellovibrionales bacterium]